MARSNLLIPTASLISLLVAGCPDTIDDINPFHEELTANNAPAAIAEAYCKRIFACPFPYDSFRAFADADGCQVILESDLRDRYRQRTELVGRGQIGFLPDELSACLEYIEGCEHPLPDFNFFCREAYSGTVELGGKCHDSFECIGGDRQVSCNAPSPTACGVCVDDGRRNLGESCDGAPCRDDETLNILVCDQTTKVCLKKEGSVFFDHGPGESCGPSQKPGDHYCQAEFWCNPDLETCQEPLPIGEACHGATEHGCVKDARCENDNDTCVANILLTEFGAECNDQGPFCDTSRRLFCDGGHCSPFDLSQGAPCGRNIGMCAPDYACLDGVCEEPRNNGEACRSHTDCAFPSHCMVEAGLPGTCSGEILACE